MLWQIAEATGWSHHHILWRIPAPTLMMMMADAPRYIKTKATDAPKESPKTKEETGAEILSFFQSHLPNKQPK